MFEDDYQKENHNRFDDLCNHDSVDKEAKAAVAAMLAAEKETELNKDVTNTLPTPTNIFISTASAVEPKIISNGVSQIEDITEKTEKLHFPSRAERENGERASSPFFAKPPKSEHENESVTDNLSQHSQSFAPQRGRYNPWATTVHTLSDDRKQERFQHASPPRSDHVDETTNKQANDAEPNDQKDLAVVQWDKNIEDAEQEQIKICYLIKIEEFAAQGIPIYKRNGKSVDIESDLATIKLCHSFMYERSKRKRNLERTKGVVKFGADVFGHVSDFFQKNGPDEDSTEWRTEIKKTIASGVYDMEIRDLSNKYEHFQPPEEFAILEILWESKQKFDEERSKKKKAEAEKTMKEGEDTLNQFEKFMENAPKQETEEDES